MIGSDEYWEKFNRRVWKKKTPPPPKKKKVKKDPELVKQEQRASMREHYKKFKDDYKEYYQKHRDQKQEYYQKNKEEILKRQNEKHICECGGKYTTNNKPIHLTTKKHKLWFCAFSQKEE